MLLHHSAEVLCEGKCWLVQMGRGYTTPSSHFNKWHRCCIHYEYFNRLRMGKCPIICCCFCIEESGFAAVGVDAFVVWGWEFHPADLCRSAASERVRCNASASRARLHPKSVCSVRPRQLPHSRLDFDHHHKSVQCVRRRPWPCTAAAASVVSSQLAALFGGAKSVSQLVQSVDVWQRNHCGCGWSEL